MNIVTPLIISSVTPACLSAFRSSRKVALQGVIGLTLLASSLSAAVNVTTIFANNTNNGSSPTGTGTSGNADAIINSNSLNLNSVGDSAELGYRFTGHNSGRAGNANPTPFNETVTQLVDVSVTWTIEATAGETYDFSVDPEFNANLVVATVGGGSIDDSTVMGAFTATLEQNSSLVGGTSGLNFTGADNNSVPGSPTSGRNVEAFNRSGTFLFEGLTGTNTFILAYSGNVIANWDKVDQNTGTANGILWGMDGTSPDANTLFNSDWDEYSKSDVLVSASNDGLFVKGTVSVVPEPSAAALILTLSGLAVAGRRRR